MEPSATRCLAAAASSLSARRLALRHQPAALRCIHTTVPTSATPVSHPTVAGPPPQPPKVAATQPEDRRARKREQAEALIQNQRTKTNPAKPSTALQKRFWKSVSVQEVEDGLQVHLDSRPVRTADRKILTLPHSKRPLATSIALEWDLLVSAQQALKNHYIPMTSIASRAMDIATDDAANKPNTRQDLVTTVMRYLGTDTLLCWAPEKNRHDPNEPQGDKSLRAQQVAVAEPIIAFLKTHIFPGVEIHPILSEESIVPRAQPEVTREVIKGWVSGLPAFELAALERGVLATKSLLVATRLVVEWSREFEGLRKDVQGQDGEDGTRRFGIEEAAEAATTEVSWQTGMWGEVEDSHDVDKADLARQLGSAVLLVS